MPPTGTGPPTPHFLMPPPSSLFLWGASLEGCQGGRGRGRRGGGGGEAVADSQASPHASKDKHLCVVGSRASAPRGRLFVVLLSLFPLSCYQDGIPGAAFLTLEGQPQLWNFFCWKFAVWVLPPLGDFPGMLMLMM